MSKLTKITGMLFLATMIFLTGCSKDSGEKASTSGEKGKTMFLGMVNPPILFNPINSSDVASQFAEKFIFDSFLEMTGPQEFAPKLAESFETTDNQTYTITLNKEAKWSDGKPVTADDVAFTFNLVANPVVETVVGGYISMFEGLDTNGKLEGGAKEIPSVKIIDDKKIEFKTKTPVDPNMIKEQLGTKFMILPKHALEKIDPAKLSQDPFMQKPTVTNGAYQFVQYKKDQYIEYKQNPDYYLGKVELSKLFIKVMPAANLVAQLQTGELHMNIAGGIGKIVPTDYETVEKIETVKTKTENTFGFQSMMFNTKTIKDPKIRKAFAQAVDRQQIVDKLLKGYGEVIDGPYTTINPYLNKDLKTITYDPAAAKKALEDAGWDFEKELNFIVPTGNKVREQAADIITQNLKDAGVKVKMTTFDFPTLMAKGKAGEFDALLMGFTFTLDPDVSSLYTKTGAYNFMSYDNPKSDELLNKGKSEADPEKRKELYDEVQEIWEEDMPIITLFSDFDFSAVSKQVTNGEPKVFGFHHETFKWNLEGAN